MLIQNKIKQKTEYFLDRFHFRHDCTCRTQSHTHNNNNNNVAAIYITTIWPIPTIDPLTTFVAILQELPRMVWRASGPAEAMVLPLQIVEL